MMGRGISSASGEQGKFGTTVAHEKHTKIRREAGGLDGRSPSERSNLIAGTKNEQH